MHVSVHLHTRTDKHMHIYTNAGLYIHAHTRIYTNSRTCVHTLVHTEPLATAVVNSVIHMYSYYETSGRGASIILYKNDFSSLFFTMINI